MTYLAEDDTIGTPCILPWRPCYHRDITRDLTITALEARFGDEEFTHGPWRTSTSDDTASERKPQGLFPSLFDSTDYMACEIVSPMRRFTLYIGKRRDGLVGINTSGDCALYDVEALLDNKEMIEEITAPLLVLN